MDVLIGGAIVVLGLTVRAVMTDLGHRLGQAIADWLFPVQK